MSKNKISCCKTKLNRGGNHAELPNTYEIPKSDEKAEADM